MRIPSYTALCSFVLSAILTVALVPSSGGAEPTTLPASASTPAAAAGIATNPAPRRPMTDVQLQKIIADTVANGKMAPILPEIATAVGLTHNGETLMAWRNCFKDPQGDRHFFFKLDNGNYLFALEENMAVAHIYYVDKDLALIAAVVKSKFEVSVIPNRDAPAGLSAELTFYANDVIDELIAGK